MNRWLQYWLAGTVLDAGTTLIGEMRWKGYEQNLIVNALGFTWAYVLMGGLVLIIYVGVRHYGKQNSWLKAGLGVVGTSRWIAGTAAGLSLLGILR